jgi:hypothetical protein
MYKKEIKNTIYARTYKAMKARNLKEGNLDIHMCNMKQKNQ